MLHSLRHLFYGATMIDVYNFNMIPILRFTFFIIISIIIFIFFADGKGNMHDVLLIVL